jgi:hypothetical protein
VNYIIQPAANGTYTLTFSGGVITGFPTHEAAARWVMDYCLRMLAMYQRAQITRSWLGGNGSPS